MELTDFPQFPDYYRSIYLNLFLYSFHTTTVSDIAMVQWYFITCQSCADSPTIHSAVTGAGLIHNFVKA